MNYPYFGQTGQGATSVPPSNQPANVQPAPSTLSPQSMPFNMNQQPYQMGQSLFPQPTGGVYNLSTASDIGNVPAGMGISVGLCLPENIIYIKALQNGSPMLLGYRLIPIEGQPNSSQPDSSQTDQIAEELRKENKQLVDVIKEHNEKIQLLENQLVKIKEKIGGGKSEWQF